MPNASSQYILKLQKELGKAVSHVEVCEHIHTRIVEIDTELHKADGLRQEKVGLISILRDLGDESVKRRRTSPQAPAIELDDNSEEAVNIRKIICEALEKYGPLTNREVIQKVGGYEQERLFFRGIKFLGEKEIVKRNEEKKLAPGDQWAERPQ